MLSKKAIIIIAIVILLLIVVPMLNKKLFGNLMAYDKGDKSFRYFKYSEFDSPAKFPEDDGKETYTASSGPHKGQVMLKNSGKENMSQQSIQVFDNIRNTIEDDWNKKNISKRIVFVANSGYRTPAYNNTLPNSVTNSAHTKGKAIDISTAKYNTEQRKEILKQLWAGGIRRVGIYDTFIHADTSTSLPTPVVWNKTGGGDFASWGIEDVKNLA